MRLVVLLSLLAAGLPTASAQEPEADRDEEGRRLFLAGAEAYSGGHYEVALTSFQAAYELTRRAALLYNIGLAHDRLRHDEQALEAYQAYLERVPSAPHREEVQARVTALSAAIEERRSREDALRAEVERAEAERQQAQQAERDAQLAASQRSASTEAEDEPSRWWIGLVIGGGVVVLGLVGLAVGLALRDDGGPSYEDSDFGGVTFTLGSR